MLITHEHFKKIYENNQIYGTTLVLILDNNCNAACRVCIAKHAFKSPLCKQYCEKFTECRYSRCCDHIASDDEFYSSVRSILNTINSSELSIMISGGEPTLSTRFRAVFDILKEYKNKITNIFMETNGANLLNDAVKEILLEHNVDIILSRYNHIEADNMQEFGFISSPVTNDVFKTILETYGKKVQVNSILLKKFIPDAEALLEVAKNMKALGANSHGFVEIMADTTLESSNRELIQYYREQLVTADELYSQLTKDPEVEVISDFRDEVSGITQYKKADLTFFITYCKMDKKYPQTPNNFYRKFLVMPSGEIGIDGIEKE